jgi:phosphatidylglycerophosphate synthase
MKEIEMDAPAVKARAVRFGWIPDAITWGRLLSLPLLWALALLRLPETLAIAATVSASTDLIDGPLARRMGVANPHGGALDSRADHLMTISLAIWLAMLRPEFLREQRVPMVLWAAYSLVVLFIGWRRRGQAVNLHLWSGKAAGFVGYAFGLLLLFTGTYSPAFFYATVGLATLAATEALLVILSGRKDVHGSILLRRRGGASRPG